MPSPPLFVHERQSTRAILETLKGHKHKVQPGLFDSLWESENRSIVDQTCKTYEYKDHWTNRLILGDSLAVMHSLKEYQGLGGQVQMIYLGPPYGIRYGSNFQPFIRNRDVKHNDYGAEKREKGGRSQY